MPALKAHGTDTSDPIKLGAALNMLFRNSRANAFVTAISTIVDRQKLEKDEGLIKQVLSLNKIYDSSLLNDPKVAALAIEVAMEDIGASLTLPLQKAIAQTLISIAQAIHRLAAALIEHPEIASIVAKLGAALTAMVAVRLASFVLGLGGLARAIGFLVAAAPIGAAARLIGMARAISALGLAASAAGVARLRAMAAGLVALNAAGGVRAALSAVGSGLLRFAAAPFVSIATGLRAVGAALLAFDLDPLVLGITVLVGGLVALGVWVKNNWSGIVTFFDAFGTSFMKALGPEAGNAVEAVSKWLKESWDWLNEMIGPLDATGAKWKSWGETAGTAAAQVVNALKPVVEILRKIIGMLNSIHVPQVSQDLGAGWLHDHVFAPMGSDKAVSGLKSVLPTWLGGTPHRALGGPVSRGTTYLVGERGPELFTPGGAGSIVTNNALRNAASRDGVLRVGVDASAIEDAGKLANQTGGSLHDALDAVRKPIVDVSSIDIAIEKTTKLASIVDTIGNSPIRFGGGRGGASGGSAVGTFPAGSSFEEVRQYIRSRASSLGMNPNIAERVARSEGLNSTLGAGGDHGTSDGPFQLHVGGGLGDAYQRQTGHSIHDKRFWRDQVDYALRHAKAGGWAPWHGAARVGIGRWEGIAGARASGGPVGRGLTYLVGERGPELFTPGAAGQITSHANFAALGRMAVEGTGSGSPSPEMIRKLQPAAPVTHTRGDTNLAVNFTINDAHDPHAVRREVETTFRDYVREMERDQAGLLSD